ncbi:MAG: hypothetical protein GC168_04455 [Candidatus Hydrogenedens sp.]|nr:hypothetical protein [Candidatus Hydrogenedens sp.]
MSDDDKQLNEGQRQCMACRNWVSVLATKCHYCGEPLGRPRREEVRMTVEDLGGVSQSQYTVSGNVMDALEAFRAENLNEQEEQRRQREEMGQSWFGKKSSFDSQGEPKHDLPELDEHHQSLAEAVLSGAAAATPRPARRKKSGISPDTIRNVGIGVAVVVVLALGYQFGYPALQGMMNPAEEPAQATYQNRARSILSSGGPTIDALEEAHTAIGHDQTEENAQILGEVRQAFISEIEAMLDARRYSQDELDKASELTQRAARVDHSPEIGDLVATVNKEVALHKFVLVSVDTENQKATFNLNNQYADQSEQTVGVGERLEDRFIVTSIMNNSVRLEDTLRKPNGRQRPLVSRPFQPVSAD